MLHFSLLPLWPVSLTKEHDAVSTTGYGPFVIVNSIQLLWRDYDKLNPKQQILSSSISFVVFVECKFWNGIELTWFTWLNWLNWLNWFNTSEGWTVLLFLNNNFHCPCFVFDRSRHALYLPSTLVMRLYSLFYEVRWFSREASPARKQKHFFPFLNNGIVQCNDKTMPPPVIHCQRKANGNYWMNCSSVVFWIIIGC